MGVGSTRRALHNAAQSIEKRQFASQTIFFMYSIVFAVKTVSPILASSLEQKTWCSSVFPIKDFIPHMIPVCVFFQRKVI